MSETATEPEAAADDQQAEQMLFDAINNSADGDTTTDQPQRSEEPATQTEPDKGNDKDWQAEATKWKSLARKHEQSAKAKAAAAEKWQEWEESQKTEQQRLADRLAAAERERDEARHNHARMVAAATYNIPPSLIDRIGGSTEEEINESAEVLAAEIEQLVSTRLASLPQPEASSSPGPAATRPVESLMPGAQPASDEPEDPNAWLRRLSGRAP